MRVHGDEPVERTGQDAGEGARRDRLALAKAPVLAQVAQIRAHQPDPRRAEVAGGVRGEEQRRELVVGTVERAQDHRRPPGQVAVDAYKAFAVGKAMPLERGGRQRQLARNPRCHRLVARKRHQGPAGVVIRLPGFHR